jgi:hypothetical protein
MRHVIVFSSLAFIGLAYTIFVMCTGFTMAWVPTAAAMLVGLAASFWPPPPRRRTRRDVLIALSFYACFLVGVFMVWNHPVHRFRRLYETIEDGMTIDQVQVLMRDQLPATRTSLRLDATEGRIKLAPDDSFGDEQTIVFAIHQGKAHDKSYYASD